MSASYILCNGAIVAPMGSSLLGCLAKQNHIPVVVVSETYKFEDRVNLDQINNNKQGPSHKNCQNYLRKQCPNKDILEKILSCKHDLNPKSDKHQVQFFNLMLDLTPYQYLSMIVCEVGNIPPHSVPVVIKEITLEFDDKEHVDDPDSDFDIVSSEEEMDDDEASPTALKKQLESSNRMSKRMQQVKGLEMEEVEENASDEDKDENKWIDKLN